MKGNIPAKKVFFVQNKRKYENIFSENSIKKETADNRRYYLWYMYNQMLHVLLFTKKSIFKNLFF